MNIYISKLCVLFLLTVCRLASGLCPLLISRKFKRKYGLDRVAKFRVEKWVGYSMDFSGGLLLATCFIHMIPEVREHLEHALRHDYKFPYAETLVCVGFFVVFVIEESVRHIAKHKTTSHQLLSKAGALIPAKGREEVAVARRCPEDRDREMSPMAATATDSNVENGAPNNGVAAASSVLCGGGGVGGIRDTGCADAVAVAGGAKFVLEMKPMMMKEELGLAECNNNMKTRPAHTMKSVLLVSALSFHSVMEGLAIGLAQEVQDVWYLFFAVTVHECTILLCVGIELVTSCPSVIAVVVYMAVFALVSPAGVLFGMMLTLSMTDSSSSSSPLREIVVSSLQGLAAGTILYVTFFEVLNNHKHHHHHHHYHHDETHSKSSIPQLIFILLGFLFMVLLELIGGHEESHFEFHSHGH